MILTRRDYAWLCLLVAIVLLSRVPFLGAGYGTQMDAWRVANVARDISGTGHYEVSRFPGFPVQEIACSLFWKGGPVALNGASALFGAAAVLLFALIARAYGCKDWFLAGLALAFAPVFYINCVSAKDYTWALAFTLSSFFACMKDRAALAGIFLGIATGCRITSCVAGLPLLVILAGNDQKRAMRRAIVFAAVSAVTATVMFLPVLLKYGTGFFTTYYHDLPDWHTILRRSTIEVWGWTGVAGLCVALAGIAWKRLRRQTTTVSLSCTGYHVAGWATAVTVYLVLYIPHPDLAGYLIAPMPFVILLLARFSARGAFQAFCVLAAAGSFVSLDHGRPVAGDIFKDHEERVATSQNITNFLSFTEQIPGKNIFVVGAWETEITNRLPGNNRYSYLLTAPEVLECMKSGTTIYYNAATIRYFNLRVYGIDLAKYGGRDIRAVYEQQMKLKNQAGAAGPP